MRKQKSAGGAGIIVTLVLFACMLVAIAGATLGHAGSADAEGVRATRDAIERTVVLGYATEGFYPPSLSYMEQRYGLQIDRLLYAVRYEVFATNVTPTIEVTPRGS